MSTKWEIGTSNSNSPRLRLKGGFRGKVTFTWTQRMSGSWPAKREVTRSLAGRTVYYRPLAEWEGEGSGRQVQGRGAGCTPVAGSC